MGTAKFAFSPVLSSSNHNLIINEVMASNGKTVANESGNFSDWIELYNNGRSTVNLNGFGLTDRLDMPYLWTFPDTSIHPGAFLLIWASGNIDGNHQNELHTNFKINKHGETITLTDSDGAVIDMVEVPISPRDISYGRRFNGSPEWAFFKKPSPGSDNVLLKFSHDSGFYNNSFGLTIEASEKETKIYYTLDSSVPTQKSTAYKIPIGIKRRMGEPNLFSNMDNTSIYWSQPKKEVFKGTIVRIRAYRKNVPVSHVITKTYFVHKTMHKKYQLPLISLVTDPINLFGFQKGIYVQGKAAEDYKKKYPQKARIKNVAGNYHEKGRHWERPVHIDFFEPNGILGFSQKAGIRIFGGPINRALSQKPFILYARKTYYTTNRFNYEIFPGLKRSKENDEVLDQFKHILLRTSGQDAAHTLFGDAMMQRLVNGILDTQAYRPGVVFFNGEYWGIYNIREHMDEHYLMDHYQLEKHEIALLEDFIGIKAGSQKDRQDFIHILRYVHTNDMRQPQHYKYIENKIDVDNFIDYNLAQIYFNNRDWPNNNRRYWRKIGANNKKDTRYGHDGKWRWLLYDTDYGFGRVSGQRAYQYNTLRFATKDGVKRGRNKEKATRLLRSLLNNEDFKRRFIMRFADYLNTIFKGDVVIQKINAIQKIIEPEMEEHIQRWGNCVFSIHSMKNWKRKVGHLRTFARKRPKHMRAHLIDFFGLKEMSKVTLNILHGLGGKIKINTITLDVQDYPWEGLYFKGIPVQIVAIPDAGFRFAGWEGGHEGKSNHLTINLEKDIALRARFKKRFKFQKMFSSRVDRIY